MILILMSINPFGKIMEKLPTFCSIPGTKNWGVFEHLDGPCNGILLQNLSLCSLFREPKMIPKVGSFSAPRWSCQRQTAKKSG